MNTYSICSLYSGSSGNSTYIDTGEARILIDAGKSAKSLCAALESIGSSIKNIDAIFITHEHTDHISALNVISKKYGIPIHIAELSASKFLNQESAAFHCIKSHSPIFTENIKNATVSSFVTPHDSNMSVGYRIDINSHQGKISIGIATDIGYVSSAVKSALIGCESVVLESNHDIDMLTFGPYPIELKKRILSKFGHLSNADCAVFARELVNNGTKNILLAHLSEENNTREIALKETTESIDNHTINIRVADPISPTLLI